MFSVSTGYKILTWYAFSFEISSKVIVLAGKVLSVTYRPAQTFLNSLAQSVKGRSNYVRRHLDR